MKSPAQLRSDAKAWIRDTSEPQPSFDIRVGWAESYDDLFANDHLSQTAAADVLSRALDTGRVLLTGPGGSGKTVALMRLLKEALARDVVVAWIDFTRWTTQDYESWRQLTSAKARLSFLVEVHASPTMSLLDLSLAPPGTTRLLFVDGLNELWEEVGQQIIYALDDYARSFPATSVIVTDRLVRRRFLRPEEWNLGRVLMLSEAEIRRVLALGDSQIENQQSGSQVFLGLPFFLDTHIRQRGNGLSGYFTQHCGLSEQELDLAADAAFLAYDSNGSRVFSLLAFETTAGRDVVNKLRTAGAFRFVGDDECWFAHHLMHDYLVARFLSSHSEAWNAEAFDAATFKGSSFDVLSLATKMIGADRGAPFIRRMYDWNLYAVGYVFAQSVGDVPAGLQVCILAMLAERRFDRIRATATRASDALMSVGTVTAKNLATAPTLADVFEVVRSIDIADAQYVAWKHLFLLPIGGSVTDVLVARLDDEDSLSGWTCSNVLKRSRLTEHQEHLVRLGLSDSKSAVVRWRCAHTLGSFPSRTNLRALLSGLEGDADYWVRYGCQRSVVELASIASAGIRERAFAKLESLLRKRRHRFAKNFARLLVVDNPPSGWLESAVPLLQTLRDLESNEERQEEIERVAADIKRQYVAVS